MNILSHIIDSGGLYGAEKVVLNLMEEQRKQAFRIKLISIGNAGVPEKVIETACSTRNLDAKPLRFKNRFNISSRASQILSSLKYLNTDIIHTHGYKSDILLGLFPQRLRKIPIVSTLHGWTSTRLFSKMRLYEYVETLFLKRIDRVVVVSRAMQSHPRLRMFGIHATVIPNGIPALNFDKQYFTSLYPEIAFACRDKVKILAMGRLSPEKGFEILIQAIARLNSRGIDTCLIVVGEGDERSNLLELAEKERIADQVHLMGYVPDAYRMIPFFDIFVLSSYTEGLPITILEAMQGGVPIVATTVGEVPDVLDYGRCGFLVPPGNMSELANAIETIHRINQEAKARAEAARLRVLSEYSVEKMTGRYLEEYDRLQK